MKVFTYNIQTGQRGSEVLGDVNCRGVGSFGDVLPEVKLPSCNPASNFVVAGHATDSQNRPIKAEHFGQDSVCFCLGKFTAGTDTSWEWVILVTPLSQGK